MKTTTRTDKGGPKCPITGKPVDPKTGRLIDPPTRMKGYPDKGINYAKAVAEGMRAGLAVKEAKRAGSPDDANATQIDGETNL